MQNRCRLTRESTVATVTTSVKECVVSKPHHHHHLPPSPSLLTNTNIAGRGNRGVCLFRTQGFFFLRVGVCLCTAYFLKHTACLCVCFESVSSTHTHSVCTANSHYTVLAISRVHSFGQFRLVMQLMNEEREITLNWIPNNIWIISHWPHKQVKTVM